MATINGVKSAYAQPRRYGLDANGPFSVYTYEGTRDEIVAKAAELEATGALWEIDESFSGAKDVLMARWSYSYSGGGGGTDVLVDLWEFYATTAEKDVLQSDNALVEAIPEDEKLKIRDALINPTPGMSPALTDAGAIYLWPLMLDGLRAIENFVPAIRHTQTVSNQYAIKASLTNVGRIFSTASMSSVEGVPAGVLFNMPASGASNRTNLSYGWRKKFPQIQGGPRTRTQIVQEWQYGLWPTGASSLMGTVI